MVKLFGKNDMKVVSPTHCFPLSHQNQIDLYDKRYTLQFLLLTDLHYKDSVEMADATLKKTLMNAQLTVAKK